MGGVDGLTLKTINQLDLSHLNLASLSACETAMTGNQTITAEYVGLVSGFLRQGVAQVISTLWVVESAASTIVMIEFYRRWRSGLPAAIALQATTEWLKHLTVAQLQSWYDDLLNQLENNEQLCHLIEMIETQQYKLGKMEPDRQPYGQPYYWSAFTLTGIQL